MSAMLDSLCGHERLQECAKTDLPVYAAGDLTPEDLASIDLEYHQRKVSGALRVRDDAQACALDQQHFDALRRAGAI